MVSFENLKGRVAKLESMEPSDTNPSKVHIVAGTMRDVKAVEQSVPDTDWIVSFVPCAGESMEDARKRVGSIAPG